MTDRGEPLAVPPEELGSFRSFLTAGRLPEPMEGLIEEHLAAKTGRPFGDPVILDRLRRAVVTQKSGYWKEGERRRISYRAGYSVLAYLAYQFPVYYFQTCHLLAWLATEGLLANDMRVVDLGTGPGVVPLAFMTLGRYLPRLSGEVLPVEPSDEHREACRHLVKGFRRPEDRVRILPALRVDAGAVDDAGVPDEIDLLVLSNLVNELPGDARERAATVMRWASHLSERGSVLLVEPADLANATGLREVQRQLVGAGLHLHHPCRFLWGSSCGPVPCWSFEERPPIRPTHLQEVLATGTKEAYRYLNTDIKFSAALLRRHRAPRIECPGVDRRRLAPLSQLHRHVGRRISCAAALMSNDLGDQKTHLFKVCDGTAQRAVYAVLPSYHVTLGNQVLLDRRYGEAVLFRDVLVRENPRTKAFNLLVNRVSRVEPCRR